MPPELLTIAICTYARPVELERCLASLVKDFAGRPIPVLVVDNCPAKPAVAEVASRFASKLSLRCIPEPRAGLSVARNVAIREASTAFIVYLDDDAVVTDGWTDAILACIRDHDPDLFGGPYRSFFADQPPQWFRDEYGSSHTKVPEGPIATGRFVSGGNMGWRTELLRGLKGFPEDLGMIAGKVGLGEETWLQNEAWRLRPALRTWFSPAMLMLHLVPPYKFKVGYWLRRSWTSGYQWQRTMENAPPGPPAEKRAPDEPQTENKVLRLLWHCWDSLRIVLTLPLRDRRAYPAWQNYAVEVIAPKVHFWGMFWRFVEQRLRG